ncbi:type II CRISPR-associated endonuclease Cas1 [Acholeplasma palmae]|uniref:type II CRISPR-associated endonuclease Cas1 n=1 Tax=Acholeplasma palmae TaxID=38986 RepID=UPI000AA832FA|nr:type II CRISPR-associated endonuclease Cas1 [Alteracholeplasma palmae]
MYIEESEYLSLYLDNIKVLKNGEELLIPISDIHTLILDNYKINLSVHLINALTKANINFILCDVDHLPQTIVLPHLGNKLGFQMLNKQLSWDDLLKGEIQQKIVKNKIKNQYELLEFLEKDEAIIEKIKEYETQVELADRTNREGLAAKLYFKALFGKEFKRFSNDVINAGLNYGYSILRSQISKVLVAKGLNTSIGFFHIGRENEFNLSDDIIEPFRPIIDYFIYKNLLEEKLFLREHRLNIIKHTTSNAVIDGKSQTIFNTIQIYVESILNYCEDRKEIKKVSINYYGL